MGKVLLGAAFAVITIELLQLNRLWRLATKPNQQIDNLKKEISAAPPAKLSPEEKKVLLAYLTLLNRWFSEDEETSWSKEASAAISDYVRSGHDQSAKQRLDERIQAHQKEQGAKNV